MGYTVFRSDERAFEAPQRGDQRRGIMPLSDSLHNSRANIWRLPAGVRGTRHVEHAQEETFVVLEGAATMYLGEPPERVELPQGSVCIVETDTGLQLRNESDSESVVLVIGAPPERGKSELLPDLD
jgi:mannose-6-phosphate isomerase-like protein (cupin superfamily)